jgi:hypothetical protein
MAKRPSRCGPRRCGRGRRTGAANSPLDSPGGSRLGNATASQRCRIRSTKRFIPVAKAVESRSGEVSVWSHRVA